MIQIDYQGSARLVATSPPCPRCSKSTATTASLLARSFTGFRFNKQVSKRLVWMCRSLMFGFSILWSWTSNKGFSIVTVPSELTMHLGRGKTTTFRGRRNSMLKKMHTKGTDDHGSVKLFLDRKFIQIIDLRRLLKSPHKQTGKQSLRMKNLLLTPLISR